MKVTFPHMGNTCIVAKALFESLGIEFVTPPPCSKKTLEIGTKYSPELACLPLKINMGNFIESIALGADTIVITGGCGPCRFGYYGAVEREILKDLGYHVEVVMLEPPNGDIKEFMKRVNKLTGGQSLWKVVKAIKNATKVAIALDDLDQLSFKTRPRERVKGRTDWIIGKFHRKIGKVEGPVAILEQIEDTKQELNGVDINEALEPLKVGIVGEIYTVIEPFTNFKIEQMLGNMGIEVYRSLSISDWIVEHMIKSALHLKKNRPYEQAAKPYLNTMIGGHAQETIGNSVLYAQQQFDGIVQMYPFSCMPEIVAESILPAISRDLDIPILTLIIDELTGEAGYRTRLEAFTDMLLRKKERRIYHHEYILSGN